MRSFLFICISLSFAFNALAWDISQVKQKKPVGEPYDRPSQKIIRNWPRPDASKIGTEPKIVSDGSLSKNLGFDKIVFIKRRPYLSTHNYTNFYDGVNPKEGGAICILDLKTKKVTELFPEMSEGTYDSFDISFDAKKIVFAYKKPGWEHGFLLYEANIDGSNLKQLTFPKDEEKWAKYKRGHFRYATNDFQPCYLPDGSIVFTSNRAHLSVLCDSAGRIEAATLFKLSKNGEISRLTYSPLSEFYPSVLEDGRILYHRWEYVDKGAGHAKCLWAMRPDGSGSVEIYGNDIVVPRTIAYGRQIPGNPDLFVALATPHFSLPDIGTVVIYDSKKDMRSPASLTYLTPYTDCRQHAALEYLEPKTGKWHSLAWRKKDKFDEIGVPAYLYKDPYPISKSLFLTSFNNGAWWAADDSYGIWLLDDCGRHEKVYSAEGISCFAPMPLLPRKVPPAIPSSLPEYLAKENLALVYVSDIYKGLDGVEKGAVKYIRIMEQPSRSIAQRHEGDEQRLSNNAVSMSLSLTPKYCHGIIEVNDDATASFYVPANKNIYFQLLDENYMLIQTERTYINYMPGEIRSCIGCHENSSEAPRTPVNRPKALSMRPKKARPMPGETSPKRIYDYQKDIQPILDAKCVSCHGGDKPAANLDLRNEETTLFNKSYESLRKYIVWPLENAETNSGEYSNPYVFGSHPSRIVNKLIKGCAGVRPDLSFEEFVRFVSWLDTGAQYHPSWHGKKNIRYKGQPDYRPEHTWESATKEFEDK